MSDIQLINITMLIFCVVICLILLICVLTAEHSKEKISRIFITIVSCLIPLICVDTVIFVLKGGGPYVKFTLQAATFLSFLLGTMLIILFIRYLMELIGFKQTISKRTIYASRIAYTLCGINIFFIALTPFTNIYYYIDENNFLQFGSLHLLSQILAFACIALNAGIVIAHRKVFDLRELIFLLSYTALPITAIIVQNVIDDVNAAIDVATTITVLIFYVGIQNEIQGELKQRELNAKIAIMLSQIQPHFLYNAMTSVAKLCDIDPTVAKQAVISFSGYLRGNMDSLTEKGLISFKKELKHIEAYLNLEKAIYGKALNVVYENLDQCFGLPPLTVQPIVENAVRHGIGRRVGGGTVTITTKKTDAEHIITVTDDGMGFEETAGSVRRGIGIDNVRRRLYEQCRGTLEIFSEKGAGTTVNIKIPVKGGSEL